MMNPNLDLDDRNRVTVMLVQALWGAISPNFRLVAIRLDESIWQLLFVLEEECSIDREEIDDITAEFDALLLGLNHEAVQFEVKTVIDTQPLPILIHRFGALSSGGENAEGKRPMTDGRQTFSDLDEDQFVRQVRAIAQDVRQSSQS
jgi:hypothetical protein